MNWFDLHQIYSLLLHPGIPVHDRIPGGTKEKVHFVLRNKNYDRYRRGQCFVYPRDDCGLWISASKVIVFKLHDEDSTLVKIPNTIMKFDINAKVLLDLRRDEIVHDMSEYVVIKKLYGTLKGCKTYQRRLTYFLEVPASMEALKTLCFVEYGTMQDTTD